MPGRRSAHCGSIRATLALVLAAALPAAPPVCHAQREQSARPPVEAEAPVQRRVRFSFTLHNERAQPLEQATFSLYAPVRQTSHQRLERLDASHPAQVQVDALGNQLLTFRLEPLAPYASRVVTIDAQLELSEHARPLPAPDPSLALFTRAERFIESDNPRIRDIARTLRSDAPMEAARSSYHWVRSALGRTGFTPEDRGALRALQDKAGDCTEHAYLLAALLRANGIPARVMGGYLMAESGLVRPHDYHNWVEFYAEGAWRIADAHQGNFARNATRYLATRVMSKALASAQGATHPLGASHRYAVAGPGLKVTMN